jgi:hypothetical protein
MRKLHLDPALKNDPKAMQKARKDLRDQIEGNKKELKAQQDNLQDENKTLTEIPAAFQRYAREITQNYHNTINNLKRFLKELTEWHQDMCKTFAKYSNHQSCQAVRGK